MCPLVAYARILRHGRKRGYRIADTGRWIPNHSVPNDMSK